MAIIFKCRSGHFKADANEYNYLLGMYYVKYFSLFIEDTSSFLISIQFMLYVPKDLYSELQLIDLLLFYPVGLSVLIP